MIVLHGRSLTAAVLAVSLPLLSGCGGHVSTPIPPAPKLGVALSASSVLILQDGTSGSADVTVTRPAGSTNPVTLDVLAPPAGLDTRIVSPGTGNTGQVMFSTQTLAAGNYPVTIQASDGVISGQAALEVSVGIVATVSTSAAGTFDTFISTSFQPASWSDNFFVQNPGATTPLENLGSQHIRIQALERDIPQIDATSWDFTYLDRVVNPILSVGDHSPQFQIARAPNFMYDSTGKFLDPTFQQFAGYCANLVRYYNAGGFTDGNGLFHQSQSPWHITWWGIYNEPNINNLTPAEYVKMYNTVVPAMLAVDPNIKLVGVELSDFGTEPQKFLPTFVSGVTAQVDAVATHFYSSCNQKDTDAQLMSTIPGFVSHVQYFYQQLATNPALANVPVWVTENNVNADYDKGGGISACNNTPFTLDLRGTSAFFAGWRPYVFSQLGQAGARSLHHWDFNADAEFGEVNGANAALYLSYWVDYWLARFFPTPPPSTIFDLTATETSSVEILATLRNDGTLVVMLANHALRNSTDNNGPGTPRTVVVDLSAWGAFNSATLLTIDASTDPAQGPAPSTVTPAPRMSVRLNGYGVAFLALK